MGAGQKHARFAVMLAGLLLAGRLAAAELYLPTHRSVTVLDADTLATAASVPTGHVAHEVAISPDGSTVYVRTEEDIQWLDTTRKQIVHRQTFLGELKKSEVHTLSMALSPDGNRLYVVLRILTMDVMGYEGGTPILKVIDVATKTVERTVLLHSLRTPACFADEKAERLYLFHDLDYTMTVLDLTAPKGQYPPPLETVQTLQNAVAQTGVLKVVPASAKGRELYVAGILPGEQFAVARIDMSSSQVEIYRNREGATVQTQAVSPDGKRLYAGFEQLLAIDLEALKAGRGNAILANIPLRAACQKMVLRPDGKRLYLSLGDAVRVLDTESLQRPADLPRDVSLPGFSPDIVYRP